jgi:hypothetical protein
MNLADILALAMLLLVGGYIVAVGVLPLLFGWLASHLFSPHAPNDHQSHSTLG